MKTKTMKKVIAMFSMVAVSVSMMGMNVAVAQTTSGDQYTPASIDTTFQISSSTATGNDPVVLAKWEEEVLPGGESGDPLHTTSGTQIYPPLVKDAKKTVTICSVVYDQQGQTTISTVKAWVTAPNIDKYCGNTGFGSPYPLALEYNPTSEMSLAMARFQAAVGAGIITYNASHVYQDVWNGINNGGMRIYCGDFDLDYEDPAGVYSIEVKAQDISNRWGTLQNDLYYIAVAGFEVDFSVIDYGIVTLQSESQVLGNGGNGAANPLDTAFNPADGLPTVRGIGNKRLQLTVEQDLMQLPYIGDVMYAARMGNADAIKVPYTANQKVQLPNTLELSGVSKLDFWITVYQTDPLNTANVYNGIMTLGCVAVDFESC